jgi:hypothetical protein
VNVNVNVDVDVVLDVVADAVVCLDAFDVQAHDSDDDSV